MPRTKTKPNKTTRTAATAIRWTAVERAPKHRWWWWLGYVYVSLLVALIAIALDEWMLALLVVVVVVAIASVQLSPPRAVKASLNAKTLKVNAQSFRLADFRAYRRSADEDADLVLVPRRTFRLRVSVPLPKSDRTRERILKHLDNQLESEGTDRTWLDRLARWMRLG